MQDRGENFSGLQTLQRLRTVRNFSADDQRSQCPFCKIIVTRDVGRAGPLEQTVFLFSENILEILNRWMLSGTIANLHDLRFYLKTSSRNRIFSACSSISRFSNLSRSASNSRIFRLQRSAKCNCVLRFYIGTIA